MQASRADQTAFQMRSIELCNNQKRYDQRKENNAQNNGDPEQCALDATASRKNTAGIGASQAAQACALTLNDHAQDEQDRDYHQRDI
jgi:hypothetical protein